MGLLLDLSDEGKDRGIAHNTDLPALRGDECPGPVTVVLYHAENGNGDAKALRHLQGGPGVGLAAVNEEHIRQGEELLVPIRRVLKAAAQNLLHGSIVVRVALQLLDAKAAVSAFQRSRAVINHHGGHDIALTGIGDIEGLHPPRRGRQVQHLPQDLQRVGHPLGGRGGSLRLLLSVALGHGAEVRLLSPLGDMDPDLMSCPAGQNFREILTFSGIKGQ